MDTDLTAAAKALNGQGGSNPFKPALSNTNILDWTITTSQGQSLFEGIIPTYETQVQTWLGNTIQANAIYASLQGSYEMLALTSLAYNNMVGAGKSPTLKADILAGNRTEAWFEIRYGSNGGKSVGPGIAKRRYEEAAMFGLYNDNTNVTLDDAKSVYRMFTLHRDTILGYDSRYSAQLGSANADLQAAGFTSVGAQPIQQALGLAYATILGDLAIGTAAHNPDIANAYAAWVAAGNNPSTFDPRNLFLDPGRDNSQQSIDPNHLAILDASRTIGNGTIPGNAILIGESAAGQFGDYLIGGQGNDLLIGGAGNDVLIAGTGHDYMAGGAGNDTYIVNAGDHVTIEDKQGINSLIIDGKSISYFYSLDGGLSYVSNVNGFSAVLSNGDFIINDSVTGTQVTLNQNFQSGDFGITLINSQPITPSTGTPDHIINGDLTPILDAKGNFQYDSLGNLITDPGKPMPNRADTLFGSAGNDLIQTGGGNNYVYATQGGNDTINGGNGNDVIYAGSGANLISGGGGQDIIIAGNGNNRIYADTQVDLATALANRQTATASGLQGDLIAVGDGNNTIVGGNGNDAIFTGTGNNTLILGNGANIVSGGVEVSAAVAGWNPVTTSGHIVFNGVTGTSAPFSVPANYHGNTFNGVPVGLGNDTLFGGKGNSTYFLSNGNNWLDAGGGNDLIQAGLGNNTIFAGTGNDTIFGGGGNNTINLESGNDYVVAEGGNNTLIGGSGNDTIFSGEQINWASSATTANNYIYGGSGNTVIMGSGGHDTLISGSASGTGKSTAINAGDGKEYIVGGAGNDTIYGGAGSDTIYAGDGNTTIQLSSSTSEVSTVYGGTGNDTIRGGAGTDVISAGDGGTTDAPTYVYAGNGTSTLYGGAGVDQLFGGSGTDTLVAGTGTSTLQGGSGTEVMYGSIGNATLIAGSGHDTLYGGNGTDLLQGSSGNTVFVAGSGNETIQGGTGHNTYQFDAGFGNVELGNTRSADTFGFGAGVSLADLTVSAAIGSDGKPALLIESGGGGQLTLDNGLNGALGQFAFANGTLLSLDQLMAQASTTPTTVAGTSGNVVFSASGNDTLVGGTGNDTIYGWNGGNTLIAGSGVTTLVGGSGNDTFVVNNPADVVQAQSTGSTTNTVLTSVSYAAPANVQNLTGSGSANLTLTGNGLNDVVTANGGNDTLSGGAGNDTLYGGAGLDTFLMGYGMGSDTAIDTSALGGIVRLKPGLALSDLLATQRGNDLLLQINGTNESMRIQGYYSNPQTAWTIQDAAGNAATPQTILDATAALHRLAVATAESNFIAHAKGELISSLLASGYLMQADGTLYEPPQLPSIERLSYTNAGVKTVTDTRADGTLANVSTTSFSTATWMDTFFGYSYDPYNASYGINLRDGSASINTVDTASNAPVIHADPYATGSLNITPRWLQMNWTAGPSSATPYSSSNTIPWGYPVYIAVPLPNGSQIYILLSTTAWGTETTREVGTITRTPLTGTAIGVLTDPGSLVTTGTTPQAVQVQYGSLRAAYEIQTIDVGAGDHTVYAASQTLVNSSTGNNNTLYGRNGSDIIVGGAVRRKNWDGTACAVLFGRSMCEAANDAEGRMAA